MKSKGIRILDDENGIVCVELPDILQEIHKGQLLHWSILDFYGMGNLGEGKSIPIFQQQITESEKGLFITWDDLIYLSKKLYEVIDIVIIGSKDETNLRRYNEDQEMYETCDIVIVMFDSCYWEVFSKDHNLINRLAAKFKDIKFLETDFQKKFKLKSENPGD